MIDSIFGFVLSVEVFLVLAYVTYEALNCLDGVIRDWYLRHAGWTR